MSNLSLSGCEPFEFELDYWKEKLQGVTPLNLSYSNSGTDNQNNDKGSVELIVDDEILKRLILLSESQSVTLYTTLLSAFKILLFRHSGQEDICVGNVISGFKQNGKVSTFTNLLALRNEINGEDPFPEFVKRVNSTVSEAYQHENVPFERVTDMLKGGDEDLNSLFQVMFILQSELESNVDSNIDELLAQYPNNCDLVFKFSEKTDGLAGIVEYNKDIYGDEAIHQLVDHYKNLLGSIVANPGRMIGEFPMLTEAEEHKLLKGLNDTTVAYSKTKTIVDLFEEQVKKTPDSKAVSFEDVELSYSELNNLSNQLGDYLRKTYKVKPDDLVGIMLERSEWMIVTIFGILKAGGAYVPITPDYPQERIDYLIQDSGCKVLIDDNELEKFKKSVDNYSKENQPVGLQPHHLAYCIYTSGSTGNPKGCLLQHNGLVNRLEWMQKAYPLTADDVILQKTTFSFDVSVWELVWWAIEGASVYMLQPGGEKSPEVIVDTIEKNKVTVMHFVPSMLSVFLEYLENDKGKLSKLNGLKQVFTSGEALTINQADRFNALFPDKSLMNLYGPTEASIDVTYFDCRKENLKGTVPIGKPIDNTQIYVLDQFRNLAPEGAAGEICIGGIGLARGYLNRPVLTNDKFIKNPFIDGERIYLTGDLGRWQPDGNLEYLGRIDDQVKIRGFRIELNEVSSVLQKHPKVKDAVVIAGTINGADKELIAYFISDAKAIDLKEYLKEKLPIYMVPGYYVCMDSIPLTSNGKVNRKTLPTPQSTGIVGEAYTAPSTDIERTLAKIWAGVLGVEAEKVSVKADFFDIGGHNIRAIRLLGLIHRELGVKLSVKDLFSGSTIEQQAETISKKESKVFEGIEAVTEQPDYDVSSAQRRLWVMHHFEGAQSAYNISVGIVLEGKLDKRALKKTFETLISRHEILRTVFSKDEDGNPRQKIKSIKEYSFKLDETDLLNIDDQDSVLKQVVDEEINKGFDLSEGPLLRCHLIRLHENKHVLVMVQHHIISDGWSMDIFRKEVSALYNKFSQGEEIQNTPIRIQYKDYAAWHTRQLEAENVAPHREYWLKQFEGDLPVLVLPTFKERPKIKSYNGASISTTINKADLTKISKANGGTLFMSLLSCLNTLFYRYTNQEDIVIGSPTAGREHPDLEDQVGFYINSLSLRTRFKGSESFETLYQQVKEVTLGAYEHQLYPYDELVDDLKLGRDMSRNPLFDVMVALQNSAEQDAEYTLNGLQTSAYEAGEFKLAKFDITIIFSESKNGLNIYLEYNTDIYNREQIEALLVHFNNIITAVAKNPKQKLAEIDFLTPHEREDLLYRFNDTLVPYPVEKTMVDLFEEQVRRTPGNVALRQHGRELSYREVNQQANQVANYLISRGINKGDNVGLIATRGFNMIIGMYGIMKAGGAYVPIDPEYPIDRQEYILHNSSVIKVVADGDYPLEGLIPAKLFVKLNKLDLTDQAKENPGLKIDSKQLAYTIYTSGSTGKPKGVMIEHHSAVNLILWVNTEFKINSNDRILFITSMCFDLSVYDIFGILAAGGSVVIVEQQELMDVPKLKDMLISEQITFWDSVPTTMDYLVRELESQDTGYLQHTLRVVFMSGDWIPVNLPDRIKKYFPKTRVISLGGATEGTVWSNFYPVERVENSWSSIPYGKPIANNFFYILNEQLQPAPIGVPGELYIGGVGVARGYANDKQKTDYSFVKDPFNDKAGGMMYRTGDLGRMLPGLNMEFIGRRDDQVKIRGYRIELGEIESVLRQSELIRQAIVLARADKEGKKRLVSYVVGKNGYERETVISYLRSKLPDYMVPTLWVELEALPLTSNGKIDKKALPDFDAEEQLKGQYTEPVNESEKLLTKIWEEVLKVKNIGVNDNFFDIGGHSLLAVQIVTKIENKTGKKFPIAVLFEHPTVKQLNEFIQKEDVEPNWKSLVPIKASGNKTPLYIVHGVGLNVLNFSSLALYVDKNQPLFGLQARGLDGIEKPLDSIPEIAKHYLSEVLEHNPTGPYAVAGYSLGGIIAAEMVHQLKAMNKEVKFLGVIDTDAGETTKRKWYRVWIMRIHRFSPKFLGGTRSLSKQLGEVAEKKLSRVLKKLGLSRQTAEAKAYYLILERVKTQLMIGYHDYKLAPLNEKVHLFKARICIHYNDDEEFLSWRKYSLKGVETHVVEGDHKQMLLPPNASGFARMLQKALDESL